MIVVNQGSKFDNIPVQNPAVLTRPTFDENILLVNGDTGASLALNKCGKVIWNLIDGKRTEEEIIAQVCTNFHNVPDTVTDDVISLITTLSNECYIGYEMNADSLEKKWEDCHE